MPTGDDVVNNAESPSQQSCFSLCGQEEDSWEEQVGALRVGPAKIKYLAELLY